LLPGTYTFQEVTPTGWTPTYNPTNRELIVVAGTDPDPGAIGTIHNCIDLGKIRILKFDGSTGLPLCCATFRITPNPHTGTSYMDVTDNDGVYDQDPDDGEIEIHNVLFGTYLIEEIVPPPGYGLAPNVTIEVINSTTIPVARFDNYPLTGCLKVIKTWEDLGTGETYTDPIDVEIYDSTGVVVGTLTLTLGNSWTDQLCNLTPGTYTFQEVSPTGWTPTYNPTNRELIVVAGTDPDPGAIGYITNTVDIGCLKVIKTWDDLGTGETYTDPITVKIYDSTGAVVGTLTLTLGNSWADQLCNLTPGTYTFQEVSPTGWTPTYNPSNRQLVVVAGTDPNPGAIGYITNTIDLGCLNITKNVILGNLVYPTGYFDGQTFEICITGYPNNLDLQWCNLLPGQYTITETDPGTSWTVEIIGSPATVPAGGYAEAWVNNTFKPGCLIVTKVIEWGEAEPEPVSIEVCIQGPSYPYPTKLCHTFTAAGTHKFDNLLPGWYWVNETDPGLGWIVTNMTNYVEVLPGNITCTHVEIINIPEDPPETYKTLIGCLYYEDPYYYITSDTQICFYAFDDRSGVAFTYIEIWWDQNLNGIEDPGEITNIIIYDNSPDDLDPAIGFIEYCMTIPDECYHQIRYYSVDNAGLIEDMQIELDLVDHTPPIIIKTHPDPCYYPTGPTSGIIKVGSRIILEAIDGGTPPCISGVEDIYYGFTYKGKWYPSDPFDEYCGNYNITKYKDDKWWYTYTMPIRFHEECKHILEYWTKDNICNTGPIQRQTYWVNKCQEEVWIDDNFGFDTPGWWHTHFRDKQMALDWLGPGGTAYVNDGVYHGDIIIDAVPCCNNTNITQKGEHGFPIGDSAIITGSETIKVNNVTIKYLEYMPNTNGSIIVVPGISGTTLRCNKFRKDCVADAIGVKALGGSIVNARLNWWGAPDGPSGGVMDDGKIADGLGVKIIGEVYVEPWLGIHAEISKPEENPLEVEVGTPVTFDATGSWAYTFGECCEEEIEKPLQYLWDFDDGKKSSNKIAVHIFDQPGTYVVSLMVDAPGIPGLYPNIMYDWAYTTIHVVTEQTPLTCNADRGSLEGYQTIVNEPLQLYGDAYGGKGEYNWYWKFGDQTADSTLQNPEHTYTEPGTYTAKLTVISNEETATDTTTVTVYDIDELFVNINNAHTIAGTETMFAASITGGTPPYSIEWDFGDGITSQENNPTHIYNNPGEYTITITVTDNKQKTAIDTATITVEEKTNVQITEIKEVIGGLGIQAVIAAGGNNCHWEITVEGNVLLGGENSGLIYANTQETVKLGFSLAIGNVDIKVKASGSEKRYTAFALGPFYLNLKEK
jgi:plastocyanin